ncbi:MAG: glycosyltransferase family 39 protein, partial [Deltaproteobacteria bacterium]|nr:glycosyltransferase family 39 protein [Deltaproteobacteria bacterium]
MSRNLTLRRAWPYLAVAAMVGARLASDLAWLSRTDYPFAADFLAWADQYSRALMESGPIRVVVRAFHESYYPPLLFALWGCVGAAFDDPRAAAPVVSAMFHLGGLCALVSLVREQTERVWPALIAAALILLAPQFAFWSRTPLLEVPMAALIPVIVWGAVRSERFTRPLPAAVAGVAAGLGLLIKWTFVTAVAGIAVAWVADTVFASLRNKSESRLAWRGFAAASVAVLVVALPWYVFGLDWDAIGSHAPTDPTDLTALGSLAWYPARLFAQAW